MSLKEFFLDVLDRTVNASWYRSVGCSPDEASFLADMETNLTRSTRAPQTITEEEIKDRLDKSKARRNETMAALVERQRKTREENPWIYEEAEKFRQEALRFREEVRKKNS